MLLHIGVCVCASSQAYSAGGLAGFDSLSGPWRHGGTTRAPLEYYALGLDSWEYIASFAFAVIVSFVCLRNSALDNEAEDRPRPGTSNTISIGVASPWRPRAKRPPGGHNKSECMTCCQSMCCDAMHRDVASVCSLETD